MSCWLLDSGLRAVHIPLHLIHLIPFTGKAKCTFLLRLSVGENCPICCCFLSAQMWPMMPSLLQFSCDFMTTFQLVSSFMSLPVLLWKPMSCIFFPPQPFLYKIPLLVCISIIFTLSSYIWWLIMPLFVSVSIIIITSSYVSTNHAFIFIHLNNHYDVILCAMTDRHWLVSALICSQPPFSPVLLQSAFCQSCSSAINLHLVSPVSPKLTGQRMEEGAWRINLYMGYFSKIPNLPWMKSAIKAAWKAFCLLSDPTNPQQDPQTVVFIVIFCVFLEECHDKLQNWLYRNYSDLCLTSSSVVEGG